jgi:hypothetical protein
MKDVSTEKNYNIVTLQRDKVRLPIMHKQTTITITTTTSMATKSTFLKEKIVVLQIEHFVKSSM